MTFIGATDYFYQVSKGAVTGSEAIRIVAHTDGMATGVTETIWTAPVAIYVVPSTARQVNVVSTSTADAAAGTGAVTVLIRGVDAALADVSETVPMNGTTNVLTVNSYLGINDATVATAGSGETNAGAITFISVTDLNHLTHMPAGESTDSSSVYTVPASPSIWSVISFDPFITEAKGSDIVLLRTTTRTAAGVKIFGGATSLVSSGTTTPHIPILLPARLAPGDVFTIEGVSDISNTEVGINIGSILET